MRPDFLIIGLTGEGNDRVLEITVEDNAGIRSDRVSIRLDDRDFKLKWPEQGKIIQILLGYKETGLINMGTFELDEPGYEHPNRTIILSANAQYHGNSNIKAPQSQPWDEKTVGAIVSEIAGRNGYTPEVDPDVANIYYDHLDQSEESDVHFLTRVADELDCFVKYQDGKLQFKPREKTNGSVTVKMADCSSLRATVNSRNDYGKVKAWWYDRDDGKKKFELAEGGDGPTFELRKTFFSKDEAKRAAASKLKQLSRGTGQINSLVIPGNPEVRAEMELFLEDFRPEICNIPWVITNATHSLTKSGGYITTIAADVDGSKVSEQSVTEEEATEEDLSAFEKAQAYSAQKFEKVEN